MKPTLKELLKPPLSFDKKSLAIHGTKVATYICDLNITQCSDKELPFLANFIIQALTEKWERDFGG